MDVKIGVLSYQGSVIEHIKMLNKISGVKAIEVKTIEGLASVDGMVLPGGESTTISKLLKYFGLLDPLRSRINQGMPVYGTCAGLILLSKHIKNEQPHLDCMNIKVSRNAYGRQLDSFSGDVLIPAFSSKKIPLVFIRAPWIDEVLSGVDVLHIQDGRIVAAREKNMLVTSFHPELTDDTTVHEYFVKMVKESLK